MRTNTRQQDTRKQDYDVKRKKLSTDYADNRNQTGEKCILKENFVLLEKRKENKLSLQYGREPYQVTARYGDQV